MNMAQKAAMAYLRTLREQRGLSQDDVARILDVKSKQISRWETGVNEPTATGLSALIAAVKASADQVTRLFIDEKATPDDGVRLAHGWLRQEALVEIDRRVAEFTDEEREAALRVLSIMLKKP